MRAMRFSFCLMNKGYDETALFREAELAEHGGQLVVLGGEEGRGLRAVLVVAGPLIPLNVGLPLRRGRDLGEGRVPPRELRRRHAARPDQRAPGVELDVDALLLPGRDIGER